MTDDPSDPQPNQPPNRSPWESPPDQPPPNRSPWESPPDQAPFQPPPAYPPTSPYGQQQPYGEAPPYQPQQPYGPPHRSPYVQPQQPSPYDRRSYQQPYGNQHWQGKPQNAGTNGFAIASLVLGIIWVFWLGSILAVIFGHIALGQIKRSGQSGHGMAVAGVILGYIGIAVFAILIIVGLAVGDNTA